MFSDLRTCVSTQVAVAETFKNRRLIYKRKGTSRLYKRNYKSERVCESFWELTVLFPQLSLSLSLSLSLTSTGFTSERRTLSVWAQNTLDTVCQSRYGDPIVTLSFDRQVLNGRLASIFAKTSRNQQLAQGRSTPIDYRYVR